MNIYKLKNINLNYLLNGNNIKILKNINFEIKKNESVAIIGESGSGKTSLLMLMSGLEKPTNGSIVFNKEDLSKINEKRTTEIRRKKIGLICLDDSIAGGVAVVVSIIPYHREEKDDSNKPERRYCVD